MELLALMAMVGVVSGQCDNLLTPSFCGLNSAAAPGNSFSGPYAIFNTGNFGFGQSQYTANQGPLHRNTCLNVDVIPLSLQDLYCSQPTYVTVVENTQANRLRDSVCTTFSPVPGDEHSLLAYISSVNTDGSSSIETVIYTQIAPGVFGVANTDFTITQRIYASVGDNLYLTCTRTEFGDSNFPQTVVSPLGSVSRVGYSCLQQITAIINCNGLYPEEGLYVLPYRMPPRCYTQQTCSNNFNTPLSFFNQGYNPSDVVIFNQQISSAQNKNKTIDY